MQVTAPTAGENTQVGPQHQARHFDFLDGIRALAALFVMLHHIWLSRFVGQVGFRSLPGWQGVCTNWLLYGHYSVDVFIVLSGFCLMLPVARDGALRGGVKGFFARRAHRILPPYYAAFVFGILFHFAGLLILKHLTINLTFPGFLANLLLLQDLNGAYDLQINGAFWSVAVEWRIYFLFPVLTAIWRRWGAAAMLITAGTTGYGLYALQVALHSPIPFFSCCCWFIGLFGLGCAAATVAGRPGTPDSRPIWRGVAALSAAVMAVVLYLCRITETGTSAQDTYLPLIDGVVGATTAAVLVVLTAQARRGDRTPTLALLSWRPLVFVGTFSYSLYLMHIPLLISAQELIVHTNNLGLGGGIFRRVLLTFLIGTPACVLACYVFHVFFERPFLNRRRAVSAAVASPPSADAKPQASSLTVLPLP